jgi:hypothetical protein
MDAEWDVRSNNWSYVVRFVERSFLHANASEVVEKQLPSFVRRSRAQSATARGAALLMNKALDKVQDTVGSPETAVLCTPRSDGKFATRVMLDRFCEISAEIAGRETTGDYDRLGGERREGKVRKSFVHLVRHRCISELPRIVRRLRPGFSSEGGTGATPSGSCIFKTSSPGIARTGDRGRGNVLWITCTDFGNRIDLFARGATGPYCRDTVHHHVAGILRRTVLEIAGFLKAGRLAPVGRDDLAWDPLPCGLGIYDDAGSVRCILAALSRHAPLSTEAGRLLAPVYERRQADKIGSLRHLKALLDALATLGIGDLCIMVNHVGEFHMACVGPDSPRALPQPSALALCFSSLLSHLSLLEYGRATRLERNRDDYTTSDSDEVRWPHAADQPRGRTHRYHS